MFFRNLVISAAKVIAVAMATIAVTFAASAMAYAAPGKVGPAITVTPSTGLNDGDAVTVKVTEFAEDAATVEVIQCGRTTSGSLVCNHADSVRLITDLGTGRGQLVVRQHFTGTSLDGSVSGQVDCAGASGECSVLARALHPGGPKASTPISFQ